MKGTAATLLFVVLIGDHLSDAVLNAIDVPVPVKGTY